MSKKQAFLQLWHTVKYLRREQILYRIFYKFSKSSAKYIVPREYAKREWRSAWSAPYLFDPCMKENFEFYFLGERASIKERADWHDVTKEKLWLYHLHYLHDLNAHNASHKVAFHKHLIDQWIMNNPPMLGNGWEPYPLSLRIVNLIKWFSRHESEVRSDWLNNLGMQAQALAAQIEYHILANHLFVNGKALIFVGAYLEGESADRWLKKGLRIIDAEISEQFLADGGHFELSPMYHANLIWDLCDLLHLSHSSNIRELKLRQDHWIRVIEKGIFWLGIMSHPDGEISFFNDAAFGMSPNFKDLLYYAKQLGLELNYEPTSKALDVAFLPDSGYCILSGQDSVKAIIDLAEIGVDYQPGHGHADILSFELSLFGQRFLVNTGTSEYGNGVERQNQRSTLAHNTICVNNQSSSEVWSGFRVGRRALPKYRDIKEEDNIITVSAAHTGYERRSIGVTHRRQWVYSSQRLVVNDLLQGTYSDAEARFYFHPAIKIISTGEYTLQCIFPKGQIAYLEIIANMNWFLGDSYWCPEFGKKQANKYLSISLKEKNHSTIQITW